MARLTTCGFEAANAPADGVSTSIGFAYAGAGNGRGGGNAAKLDMQTASSNFFGFTENGTNPGVYIRGYVNIDSTVTVPIKFFNTDPAPHPYLQWNPITQHVEVWSTWTNTASAEMLVDSQFTITPGTWTYIGFSSMLATNAVEAFYTLYVEDRSISGRCVLYSVATSAVANKVFLPQPQAANPVAGFCYLDDLAVNDNSGTAPHNTIPGQGYIRNLYPTSDNARGVFVAGAGGTTNLWDAMNNLPPVGLANASATNTSQTKSSGSSAGSGLFNISTFNAAGFSGLGTNVYGAEVVAMGGGQGGNALSALTGSFNGGLVGGSLVGSNWYIDAGSINVGTYPTGWARESTGFITMNVATTSVGGNILTIRKDNGTTNDTHCCYLAAVCEINTPTGIISPTTTIGTAVVTNVSIVTAAKQHDPKADMKVTQTKKIVTAQGNHHTNKVSQFMTTILKVLAINKIAPVVRADFKLTQIRKTLSIFTAHPVFLGTTPSTAVRKIVPMVAAHPVWTGNIYAQAVLKIVPVIPHQNGPGPNLHPATRILPIITGRVVAARSTGDTLLVIPEWGRPLVVQASGIRRRITKVDEA